jgi:hypothetical protein
MNRAQYRLPFAVLRKYPQRILANENPCKLDWVTERYRYVIVLLCVQHWTRSIGICMLGKVFATSRVPGRTHDE